MKTCDLPKKNQTKKKNQNEAWGLEPETSRTQSERAYHYTTGRYVKPELIMVIYTQGLARRLRGA